MGLWKRGGVWWAYFYIDGVRHQVSTGTANKKQAEKIFQKRREEAVARHHQLVEFDPDLTVGALAIRFVAKGASTVYHRERLKSILAYFADLPIGKVNRAVADEYRQGRKAGDKVSDATVNRDLGVLRRILYWAVDESLILANPLARLRLVRERRVRRPVLSVEEEAPLLAAASEHLRLIIVAALDTGMRRGEILGQLWEHVDFPRRLLSVTRSKTPEGEAREIPLTHRLFSILEKNRQAEGPVFTFEGQAIQNIDRAWRSAIRRGEIRPLRFHDLRHSFNTRLMEAGVLQEVRMALMGHSSGERVHSIYTHIELPVKRDAIAKLEQWVERQSKRKGGTHEKSEKDRTGKVIRFPAKTVAQKDSC